MTIGIEAGASQPQFSICRRSAHCFLRCNCRLQRGGRLVTAPPVRKIVRTGLRGTHPASLWL